MKRSIAIVLGCALALSGCKTTGTADPYAPLALAPGKGAVVFTIDRHGRAIDRPFAIHAVRYDPRTGKVLSDSGDDGEGFKAIYATNPEIGQDAKQWAFELEPGNYAIASIDRVGVATQPVFTGGNIAVLLIATAIATAASHAIAAAEHESHEFIDDDHIGPQTPTFTVAAGRVTHIGDFSFGGENRAVEKMVPASNWGGPNAVGTDTSKREEVTEIRTVVHYAFEPETVDGYLRIRKLDRFPITHQRLAPLVGKPFVLEDYPGESDENRTPLRTVSSSGSIVPAAVTSPATQSTPDPVPPRLDTPREVTGQPAAGKAGVATYQSSGLAISPDKASLLTGAPGQTPQSAAPVAPALWPQRPDNLGKLMDRFLAGEISKEEYDALRARLSKGS